MNSLSWVILSLAAPAEAGNELAPAPKPPVLDFIDQTLLWAGWLTLALAGWWWFKKRRPDLLAQAPPRPNDLRPEFVIILVAGFFAALAGLQWVVGRLGDPEAWRIAAANLAQALGGAGAIAVGACSFQGRARAFLCGRRPIGTAVLEGVVLFPAAVSLCSLVYLLTVELYTWWNPKFEPTVHTVLKALQAGGVPLWILWAGAIIIAPIAEECFFRGLLQTMMRNAGVGAWLSAAVTGVLFGISHGQQPDAVPTLIMFGFILGIMYERTGSLIAPMTLHALFNAKTMLWETIAAYA